MNSPRLDQLKKFLEEEPHDPFNWYMLALEYAKSNTEEAMKVFDKLLLEHESYLPTYYQAAMLYLNNGDTEKAIPVFEKGIIIARQQNNRKALSELQSALDELLFE